MGVLAGYVWVEQIFGHSLGDRTTAVAIYRASFLGQESSSIYNTPFSVVLLMRFVGVTRLRCILLSWVQGSLTFSCLAVTSQCYSGLTWEMIAPDNASTYVDDMCSYTRTRSLPTFATHGGKWMTSHLNIRMPYLAGMLSTTQMTRMFSCGRNGLLGTNLHGQGHPEARASSRTLTFHHIYGTLTGATGEGTRRRLRRDALANTFWAGIVNTTTTSTTTTRCRHCRRHS